MFPKTGSTLPFRSYSDEVRWASRGPGGLGGRSRGLTSLTGVAASAALLASVVTASPAQAVGSGLVGQSTAAVLPVTVLGSASVVPDSQMARLKRVGGTATRLSGADRYATAVAVSKSIAPTGTREVVLATGGAFPDALAAGPLAARLSGVLLNTAPTTLPPVIRDELARLKPQRITVVGGTGAVSMAVLNAARTAAGGASVAVRRLEGADRYLTARRVAAEFPAGVRGTVLASGADFPDGVAAGPVAAALGGPVLLSPRASLTTAVRAELTRLAPKRLVLAGGTGALSATVESSAESATGRQAERAAGADRYATSAALAKVLVSTGKASAAFVARGMAFPDALVGGVAAARNHAPVLLTASTSARASATAAEVGRLRGLGSWVQLTLDALARQQSLPTGQTAYDAAHQWSALGILYGWSDPEATSQLQRLRATRKPDGGYGVDGAWDAFQDGTVNPASASYLITITDHAGRALLEGYKAGVIPASEVRSLVDLVLSWPSVQGDPNCLAYTRQPSDGRYCVYNVNSGAAWFLRASYDAGIRRTGQLELSRRLYAHDAALQHDGWWPYSSAAKPGSYQDWNHNAAMIDMQLDLDRAAGQRAVDAVMPGGWVHPVSSLRRYDDAMGYTRVLPHACGYRSSALVAADRAILPKQKSNAADTGQLTLWAARTARSCGA